MRGFFRLAPILLILTLAMTACSSGKSDNQVQSYKETKSMVLDILKTEEAKKEMEKAAAEAQKKEDQNKLQVLSTGNGQMIQMAVKDVLTTTNSSKLLQDMMKDPKFAGDFAKAIEKENKQLHKDLLNDPEYQKSMFNALKNPEFEKMIMDIMKSAQYRQQINTVMEQSMQSPLFRVELMKIFKKVVEEEQQPKKSDEKKEGQEKDGGSEEDQKENQSVKESK
ncbi:MAG: hypothetical protein A2189_03205 [Paenibacillus sp. RIFOXYA1_FULL_44_5]|nr:MAG: hypothetical protein A2189_03205 [Paenibacillus sp. RIFOXYA1_FULL_44_5]